MASVSEPFVGEIREFDGQQAPEGWVFCQGQLLTIQEFPELFAVTGDQFGGDGRTTFALPALRGTEPPGEAAAGRSGPAGATRFIIAVVGRAPQHVER